MKNIPKKSIFHFFRFFRRKSVTEYPLFFFLKSPKYFQSQIFTIFEEFSKKADFGHF